MRYIFVLAFILRITAALFADDAMSPLAARYRSDAAIAQASGRSRDARNAWYKYLATRSLEPNSISLEDRRSVEECIAALTPTPIVPRTPQTRAMPVNITPARENNAPRRIATEPLINKAAILKRNGQIEEALRLYRLVLDEQPNNKDALRGVKEIQKEMN